MNTTPTAQPASKQPGLLRGIFARGAQILFLLVFMGVVLFLGSGDIRWVAAWAYLGISLLSILVNSIFMLRTNPETVAERGQARGWKDWDKTVSGLWALFQYLILPLVAALDHRYGWTGGIAAGWQVAGALIYAASLALSGWAMITNAYFSTAAKIQEERGQRVCRTGPYRFVRHPGYIGFILQSPGMALLFGSLWAFIPAGLAMACMVMRTVFEDHMLQEELEGYKDYAQEVKFKLVPGLW